MRLSRVMFGVVFLLGTCASAPSQEVFLQKEGQFLYPPNLSVGPDGLLLGMSIGSVKGYPLSATIDAENTRTDAHGQTVVTHYRSRIYRDSQGRTRLEWSITPLEAQPDSGRDAVEIYDAPTRIIVHITPSTRTASKGYFPTPEEAKQYACDPEDLPQLDAKSVESLELLAIPKVSQIELAHDLVDSLKVRHGRETVSFPRKSAAQSTITDYWFSQELQYFVLVKRSGPGKSQHVVRLSDIRREEPDPALFGVPAGYTVSGPRPLSKDDCRPKEFCPVP